MSNSKLYSGQVHVSPEDTKVLKRVFVNHLLIYNYSLSLLYDNPELRFEVLSKKVVDYVASKGLDPIIKAAVHNEIYYQFKKFRRNVRVKKHLTDLQYFTLTVGSYNNNNFTTNEACDTITLTGLNVTLKLEGALPDPGDVNMLYFNVSYSSMEDKFMLSVYISG